MFNSLLTSLRKGKKKCNCKSGTDCDWHAAWIWAAEMFPRTSSKNKKLRFIFQLIYQVVQQRVGHEGQTDASNDWLIFVSICWHTRGMTYPLFVGHVDDWTAALPRLEATFSVGRPSIYFPEHYCISKREETRSWFAGLRAKLSPDQLLCITA